MKIRKWYLFLDFNTDKHYYFDSTNWDVSDEELSLCIDEQVYGDLLKKGDEE